jgi:hypothetical protein
LPSADTLNRAGEPQLSPALSHRFAKPGHCSAAAIAERKSLKCFDAREIAIGGNKEEAYGFCKEAFLRYWGDLVLQHPNSLFVQGDEVYVTDFGHSCVQVFDRLGAPLRG